MMWGFLALAYFSVSTFCLVRYSGIHRMGKAEAILLLFGTAALPLFAVRLIMERIQEDAR